MCRHSGHLRAHAISSSSAWIVTSFSFVIIAGLLSFVRVGIVLLLMVLLLYNSGGERICFVCALRSSCTMGGRMRLFDDASEWSQHQANFMFLNRARGKMLHIIVPPLVSSHVPLGLLLKYSATHRLIRFIIRHDYLFCVQSHTFSLILRI